MVEQAVNLFGFLILTFLGFVLPIMMVLLSVFQEGLSRLTTQYENERSQAEHNIKEQLAKLARKKHTDTALIKQSLRELESLKSTAKTKLSLLNPKKQIFWLFIPLIFSFLGLIIFNLIEPNISYLFLGGSILLFVYAIVRFWPLLSIIVEVRRAVDADKKEESTKTIELLSALVRNLEKTGEYFLTNTHIKLDGKQIRDESFNITLPSNQQKQLTVAINNREKRMAKNIEIGFIFPPDFIIEKTDYYSIYTDETRQIVRYEQKAIQGDTLLELPPLIITPLKVDDYMITTFIKAENIESKYHSINIKVT